MAQVKFNKIEAEKELDRLTSEMEFRLDEDKYPQLAKMSSRGNDHNWKEYFTKHDAVAEGCDR